MRRSWPEPAATLAFRKKVPATITGRKSAFAHFSSLFSSSSTFPEIRSWVIASPCKQARRMLLRRRRRRDLQKLWKFALIYDNEMALLRWWREHVVIAISYRNLGNWFKGKAKARISSSGKRAIWNESCLIAFTFFLEQKIKLNNATPSGDKWFTRRRLHTCRRNSLPFVRKNLNFHSNPTHTHTLRHVWRVFFWDKLQRNLRGLHSIVRTSKQPSCSVVCLLLTTVTNNLISSLESFSSWYICIVGCPHVQLYCWGVVQ